MKRKILEISYCSTQLFCVFDDQAKRNPFTLYRTWWDNGHHQHKIGSYANFDSIMYTICEIGRNDPVLFREWKNDYFGREQA